MTWILLLGARQIEFQTKNDRNISVYSSKLRHVLVRHEQAAALAADGYARVTGKVGVCMATSGPGATNLVTGIANAYLDSIPLVAITGQVPTGLLGTDAFHRNATKPVIYAGGGIGIGGAVEEFRRFVETTRIPVVATLKGLGALPTDHALFLGMLGMHGTEAANTAVQASDLLVCVGARFDDRATGKLATFAPDAKVIHMDIDRAELGKLRRPDVGLVGDLRPALSALTFPLETLAWREECLTFKETHQWRYDAPTELVYGPRFLKKLSEAMDENTIIACDVGQHQMWVAQHCRFRHPHQHLTSAGLGTMGYGLPAAIGAHFGRPEATIITVSGDGSIMMNLQELATLRRYQVPVKIVVLDNQALGLVRQWQELFFERRYSEVELPDNPDFVQVAASFGIPGFAVEAGKDEESAIERLLGEPGPQLVHVRIDQEANVWPLVPPNKSNSEMLMGVHR
jgi:acetolactate synthase-1/2/3 large subunit